MLEHDVRVLVGRQATDTAYSIVKFILGSDGSKWLFTHAVDEGKIEKKDFSATVSAAFIAGRAAS